MSVAPLRDNEAAVLQRISAALSVFCFLDYDGTLAPLAPTPGAAVPPPDTAALLRQLAALPGVRVAVVTGRSIDDVRRFVAVDGIYYVGIHGLETRFPDGTSDLFEEAAVISSTLVAIGEQVADALGTRAGVLVEDKGLALAFHYRLASHDDAEAVRHAVRAVTDTYRQRGVPVVMTHGHEVVEVRPAVANKGKAVCRLLAAHPVAALAVYIGDDQTDEDAFKLLPADAITIRVGAETVSTAARYRLENPDEVHGFLRALIKNRRG